MLENFQSSTRAIFFGDILLVLCCGFCLAWWFLAFRVNNLSSVTALVLAVLIVIVVAASLVCYVLFYRLEPRLAFWDGVIPLLLIALTMAALPISLLVHLR